MLATEEHLIWHGLCQYTLCIASRNPLSLLLSDPSAFWCSAPFCFTPATCQAASLIPTAFQHFPSRPAVELQLGLVPPASSALCQRSGSLSQCSRVLVLPAKPAEELRYDIKLSLTGTAALAQKNWMWRPSTRKRIWQQTLWSSKKSPANTRGSVQEQHRLPKPDCKHWSSKGGPQVTSIPMHAWKVKVSAICHTATQWKGSIKHLKWQNTGTPGQWMTTELEQVRVRYTDLPFPSS